MEKPNTIIIYAMRTLLIPIFLFLIVPGGIAQRRTIKERPIPIREATENEIFTNYNPDASFKGGHEKWVRFLKKNIRIDSIDKYKLAPTGCQSFKIRFIVDKSGQLSDFTVLDSVHPVFAAEAIRVMHLSPPWQPAMQGGYYVKAYRMQPFTFCIEEEDTDSTEDNTRPIIKAKLDSSLGDQHVWFAAQLKKIPMELLLPDTVSLYNSKISVQFVLNNGIADSLVFNTAHIPTVLQKELGRLIQTPGIWQPAAGEKRNVLYEAVIEILLDRVPVYLCL